MLVVIFPTLLETSLIKARLIFSTVVARVISPDKSVVNLLVNVVFADSATVARAISPDKSVVNLVDNAVLTISAALARVTSTAKLEETSNVNALELVVRLLTTVVKSIKSPEISVIIASIKLSFVVARDVSVDIAADKLPIWVLIVVE